MHELSLLQNLVHIVENEARKAHANEVKSITLEIGPCAGIDPSAFDFSWPIAVKNTVLEKAKRIVKTTQSMALCRNCNREFSPMRAYDPCSNCGSYDHQIIQGLDFKIVSMAIT